MEGGKMEEKGRGKDGGEWKGKGEGKKRRKKTPIISYTPFRFSRNMPDHLPPQTFTNKQ